MAQQDYYQILGVAKDAETKTIKDAYRDLAFKYHPDRNKEDTEAVDRMKAVNEAYAVLSNPEKRRAYDALQHQYGASAHSQFRQHYTDRDIFSGSDIFRIFEEITRMHGFRGSDDIFREFYGPGYRSFRGRRGGMHFRGFVYRGPGPGGGRGHRVRGGPGGAGVGRLARLLLERLTGVTLPQAGADAEDVIRLSPEKAHEGGPYAYEYRQGKKKLVVQIPAGVRAGQRIRLAGLGGQGRGGAPPGDLYLKVEIVRPVLKRWRDRLKQWLPKA